ncbi:CRISP/Allergen/PR-1-like [Haemaphysalis longicornis]
MTRKKKTVKMEIKTIAFVWGFLFDAVTSLPLGSQQWNMCYMDCQRHPSHTICRPPKSSCRVRMTGVDAAARSEILKVHNNYRSQVALGQLNGYPPAADMQELLWDDDLARVAQAWAEQCERKHDPGIDRCTRRFQAVGQNLGNTLTQDVSGTNWPGIITAWFEEYKIYRPQPSGPRLATWVVASPTSTEYTVAGHTHGFTLATTLRLETS